MDTTCTAMVTESSGHGAHRNGHNRLQGHRLYRNGHIELQDTDYTVMVTRDSGHKPTTYFLGVCGTINWMPITTAPPFERIWLGYHRRINKFCLQWCQTFGFPYEHPEAIWWTDGPCGEWRR